MYIACVVYNMHITRNILGFWYYLKPGCFALTVKVHSIEVRKMIFTTPLHYKKGFKKRCKAVLIKDVL